MLKPEVMNVPHLKKSTLLSNFSLNKDFDLSRFLARRGTFIVLRKGHL
jgi:hypothetical protein